MSFVVRGLPVNPVEREVVVARLIAERAAYARLSFEEMAAFTEWQGGTGSPPGPARPTRPVGLPRPPRGLWGRLFGVAVLLIALGGCSSDADTASDNLSKAAEQFEIERRIVFVNGITDKYMLVVEGKCSIDDKDRQLEVTCKTGADTYKKHFLGLSDNVTYVVEQVEGANVSRYHYRVIFKPEAIVPDVDRP